MSTSGSSSSKNKTSLMRGIRRHFDEFVTIAVVWLITRAAVLSPLLLPRLSRGKLPEWISFALAAVVYILLAMPLRFWSREKMRRFYFTRNASDHHRNPYEKWLNTGILRHLRGILWGLPFLACMFYLLVLRKFLDVKTFEAPIHWLAMTLAGKSVSDTGTGNMFLALVVIGCVIGLFGLLFAYGWWRDLPVEFMPVRSIGTQKTFHWSRRIRKRHGKELRANAVVNILLCVPAVAGVLAVMGPYVAKNVDLSLSRDIVLSLVLRLLRQPLPRLQLIELAGVFAVLYAPFCLIRKARDAALIGQLMHENSHHSHHHDENREQHAHPNDEGIDQEKLRSHLEHLGEEKPEKDAAQNGEKKDPQA